MANIRKRFFPQNLLVYGIVKGTKKSVRRIFKTRTFGTLSCRRTIPKAFYQESENEEKGEENGGCVSHGT